jgi:hypothetical protein
MFEVNDPLDRGDVFFMLVPGTDTDADRPKSWISRIKRSQVLSWIWGRRSVEVPVPDRDQQRVHGYFEHMLGDEIRSVTRRD